MLSDEQIIQKILSGERKLFEVLMRRYNQQLFRIQRAYIKEEENLREVLQTTYIKVYTKYIPLRKSHASLHGW
ncbi:hypothetical protein [Marivirga sp.]|uniref:hypothetical protein n=1 Tax=Marivirga sp. TaxID=2018662 RepID=UPI002D8053F1|nr:hypothetical protein [Marivirga sp.]HET8860943.1 hypothetical protein [Marivirga sp.]